MKKKLRTRVLAITALLVLTMLGADAQNTISGNVYNDTNGLSDNSVNGTGTNAGGLKVILVNTSSGNVTAFMAVPASGIYSFAGVTNGNYSLLITINTATVGSPAPAVLLPTGWINTGENLGAGVGNDGNVNGILSLGLVNSNTSNANFGITPAGYIYIHKKALDESSSVDFSFSISGGSTTVPGFQLNDKPDWVRLRDIGSSQNGRLYAVGLDNNNLYYRDAGSSQWIYTGITNIYRVDGGSGNTCYYIDWNKDTYSYDGVSVATKISGWNGSSPTFDVASTWDNLPYVTSNDGRLWRYNGTPFSWIQVGASTNNQFIDGDPSSGDIIASKTDNNVYRITSSGAATNLGRASGLSASSNAYDVAVDANGQVYAVFENSALDKFVYKWQSGTSWAAKEVTSRIVAGANYPLTAGIGGQVWLVYDNYSSDMYGTIFSRSTDGTNVWWVDDERVRIAPANGNSEIIAVVPGAYTVSETVPANWDLQEIELYDPTSNSTKNVVGNSATLSVAAGETVHAIFRNGAVNPFVMTNNCGTAYLEDFGAGAVGTYGGPLTGQTSYHLSQSTTNIEDGYYKVVSRANPDAATWAANIFDHTTGNGTGRMMVVNAAYDQNEFFRRRFTGLVAGANYSFSAWIANISGGIPPNVRFNVIDPTTYAVLATTTSGDITSSGVWGQYALNFTATSSVIDLVLVNNSIGGGGNDLALDDIRFAMTPPNTPGTTVINAACSSTGSITVTSPVGAAYEYSKDGGTSWQSATIFSSLNPGIYTISTRYVGTTGCVSTKQDTIKAAICGTLFDDANGLTDNTVNGTGTNAGVTLYAILYNNSTGVVFDTVVVNATGNYTLNATPGSNYSVYISTTPVTIGQTAVPVVVMPAGWMNTGENLGSGFGNDGTVDGILNLGTVSSNISQANFGITQAGYIYVHKKAIDELSSKNFSFSLSGGPSPVGTILLNDSSEANIPVQDIGAAQNGRLWAAGMNDNTLYYRNLGSGLWVATTVTNAIRVDGAQGNNCYYVTTTGNVRFYDAITNTTTQIYNGGAATDVGCAWDGLPYIVANGGGLYHYTGSGNGTHGSAIWPAVNSSVNNLYVDGNPVNGDAIVVKNEWHIWDIKASGTETSLGRPAGTSAASANDVAVDENGNIYANYPGTSSVTGSVGAYPYKWISGTTWTTDETTGGNASTGNTGNMTAGAGGQVWLIQASGGGSFNYGTIFSRTDNNGTINWYDNDWVRTGGVYNNAEMIQVIPGSYTLTEALPAGWSLAGIDIYDPSNNSSGTVSTKTSVLDVAAGEVVHVNYTNAAISIIPGGTSCGTSVIENFGSGTATFGPPEFGSTAYHYDQLNKVDDGYYTIIKNSAGWPNTTLTDHTGLTNGYFLAVNASFTKNEFYRKRVSGLIIGASYKLSFWAADLSPSGILRPNVKLGIEDITTGALLNSVNTGNISATSWTQFSFTFIATASSLDIFIRNNGQGGRGNDIAIDDISFNLAPINTPATSVIQANCSAQGSITVTSPVGAAYEYSKDGGASWQSGVTFGALNPGIYTISTRYIGSTGCVSTKQDTIKAAICGNLFDDANGLTDNTVNGTGTNAGGLMNAVLYDNTTGKVVAIVPVAADGSFSFTAQPGDNYSIYITSATAAIGQTNPPSVVFPANWVSTGENLGAGAGNDGTVNSILNIGTVNSNVTNANFGIEQLPVASPRAQTIPYPKGGVMNAGTVSTPVLGNDAEDGPLGNSNTIVITQLPVNATMLYNGVPVTLNQVITGFNPALLSYTGIATGSTSVSFNYAFVDAAGKQGSNASYTVNWTGALPITLTSFSGMQQSCLVNLFWSSAEEINFSYFEIQRSSNNGSSFDKVGTIPARGNNSSYKTTDNPGYDGTFLYRLRLVDRDGNYSYSQTIPVIIACVRGVTAAVYPNPVSTLLSITGIRSGNEIRLLNTAGQILLTKKAGGNTEILDLRTLLPGVYILEILETETGKKTTLKIIRSFS